MNENRFVNLLFPTPVHGVNFSKEEIDNINKEMSNAISDIEWVTPTGWGQTHDLSTVGFTEDLIEKYRLHTFKELLERELKIYCEYLKFEPRKYKVFSWFSKFNPGDFGHIHTHGISDISGCYYFKTNGNDGNIYFQSPVNAAESSLCFQEYSRSWTYNPEVGKMLLFPGWLNHGIQKNETSETRISFSFNIVFER